MSLFKNRPPASLIGLKFERNRLEGVVLRRGPDGLQIQRSFQAALSLDPLTNDPELVGREIRNHLNEQGIRERRCAICVPLSWALTLQAKVPEMPEADVSDFLQIEAEKGFPYSLEDLSVSSARFRAPGGEQYAIIVAIPRNHLTLLRRALKAAQLKPVTVSLAISALQDSRKEKSPGDISLLIGETSVELQVASGASVVALRSLQDAIETNGTQKRVDADQVTREIKITLGQLPRDLTEVIRKLQIFGRPELARPLAEEIRPWAKSMGLDVDAAATQQVNGLPHPLAADKNISPVVSLAARHMLGHPAGFEFLSPEVSGWSQALARFSSRKFLWAGAPATALLLLAGTAFFVQHWKLSNLESTWRGMEAKVTQLENLQQRIRTFQPWFDDSQRALSIMQKLAEAFPDDGAVSAKRLEIKNLALVTCTGAAQNDQALMKTLDQLRLAKEVGDLNYDRLQGKSPLQFSINFRWSERAIHEN